MADGNYDIANLSSGDSTDDEDCPKKSVSFCFSFVYFSFVGTCAWLYSVFSVCVLSPHSLSLSLFLCNSLCLSFLCLIFLSFFQKVPKWAASASVFQLMREQEKNLESRRVNVDGIFPPEQLLCEPDLARIFKEKRRRFFKRSSSAHWVSPILKKPRLSNDSV